MRSLYTKQKHCAVITDNFDIFGNCRVGVSGGWSPGAGEGMGGGGRRGENQKRLQCLVLFIDQLILCLLGKILTMVQTIQSKALTS